MEEKGILLLFGSYQTVRPGLTFNKFLPPARPPIPERVERLRSVSRRFESSAKSKSFLVYLNHPLERWSLSHSRFLGVKGSYQLLDFVSYSWRDRAVRDRATARCHQAPQGRTRVQVETLLFRLPFSVFVKSLQEVFDRCA